MTTLIWVLGIIAYFCLAGVQLSFAAHEYGKVLPVMLPDCETGEGIYTTAQDGQRGFWVFVACASVIWPVVLVFGVLYQILWALPFWVFQVNEARGKAEALRRERELEEAKKEPAPVKARPLERVDPHW